MAWYTYGLTDVASSSMAFKSSEPGPAELVRNPGLDFRQICKPPACGISAHDKQTPEANEMASGGSASCSGSGSSGGR